MTVMFLMRHQAKLFDLPGDLAMLWKSKSQMCQGLLPQGRFVELSSREIKVPETLWWKRPLCLCCFCYVTCN